MERGKRRIHQKPNSEQMAACRTWLEQELELVEPEVVVAMGATAVKALFGSRATITSLRGEIQQSELAGPTVVTVHPAAVVRLQDREERHAERDALAGDLQMAAQEAGLP